MKKNFSITNGILVLVLLMILSLLSYDIFKEPAVTKTTIAKLQASVDIIENYTKELQTLGNMSRQKIVEEDMIKNQTDFDRSSRYKELLNKYGVFKHNEKLIDYSYDSNYEYYHERMYPKNESE